MFGFGSFRICSKTISKIEILGNEKNQMSLKCKSKYFHHAEIVPASNIAAEEAAYEFAKKHGMDHVSIHPCNLAGPTRSLGCASSMVLLQGSEDY